MFKLKKLSARGFSHIFTPLGIVVIIAAIGTYIIVGSHAATPPPTTASFSGTITQDECATSKLPIGDVGCSITVSSSNSTAPKVVTVAHGNIRQTQPWGRVIGFSSLLTNYTGRSVNVYAATIYTPAGIRYTLKGSTAYYVRLLLPKPNCYTLPNGTRICT